MMCFDKEILGNRKEMLKHYCFYIVIIQEEF